jgi:hypothetical protein
MLDGTVHVGPDPALRGLARRIWRHGITEISRSLMWSLFVCVVRHMIPGIEEAGTYDGTAVACGPRSSVARES